MDGVKRQINEVGTNLLRKITEFMINMNRIKGNLCYGKNYNSERRYKIARVQINQINKFYGNKQIRGSNYQRS